MTSGLTTEWTASTDAGDAPAMRGVVDRDTWQAEIDALRVREKRHTREGDAIAAARRRLPMVEVDPTVTLVGADGPVTLLKAFEGRQQLIAYYFGGLQPSPEGLEELHAFEQRLLLADRPQLGRGHVDIVVQAGREGKWRPRGRPRNRRSATGSAAPPRGERALVPALLSCRVRTRSGSPTVLPCGNEARGRPGREGQRLRPTPRGAPADPRTLRGFCRDL